MDTPCSSFNSYVLTSSILDKLINDVIAIFNYSYNRGNIDRATVYNYSEVFLLLIDQASDSHETEIKEIS